MRLDKALGPMGTLENAAGAYLVFWWKDIPLGHAIIPAREFPLNEADLQRRISRAIAPAVGNYLLEKVLRHPCLLLAPHATAPSPTYSYSRSNRSLLSVGHWRVWRPKFCEASRETAVSVLVCTRRRPERLRRCLDALRQLDPHPVEIIVVDNAPEEHRSRDVVEAFSGVIYLHGTRRRDQPGTEQRHFAFFR